MKLSDYALAFQHNRVIDDASLESYAALVKSLNDLVIKAANERLAVDDEPSDYERLVLKAQS